MKSPKSVFVFALAAIPVVSAGVVLLNRPQNHPPISIDPGWSPERLHEELERRGLRYEGRRQGLGYLLKAPNHPLSWEEAGAITERTGVGSYLPKGLVYITVRSPLVEGPRPPRPTDVEEGVFYLSHFYLKGHPDELRLVLDTLGGY